MSETPAHLMGLRPSQADVIYEYRGGRMGISAVPGSGKTHILSTLAVDLILNQDIDLGQEVLIVTMSNAAVNNFSERIGRMLKNAGVITGIGYRVRTLHGLAHDIVRERPGLVNLANDFSIIDDREALSIREDAALAWIKANPEVLDAYLDPDLAQEKRANLRQNRLPRLVQDMTLSMIKYAKDLELTPEALAEQLQALPTPLPLAEMGLAVYREYQRSLAYRGAVDFDDLIRLALAALRADPALVRRLREQWPFILEDEAQDSSRLQQTILDLLTGDRGNWVRVGDPNQAIYETFTTADPRHLVQFIGLPDVLRKDLPVSGRSSRSIRSLANRLIEWTQLAHPLMQARDALHLPLIEPTLPDDLQQNPPDRPEWVFLSTEKMTPDEELERVVQRLVAWHEVQLGLPEEQRETLAVLDLQNKRGSDLAKLLQEKGLDPVELLQTTLTTRQSAGTLAHILRCLANPQSEMKLAWAFEVWCKRGRHEDNDSEITQAVVKRAAGILRRWKQVEDYLYPPEGQEWQELADLAESDNEVYELLVTFRLLARRWHGASLLPVDQVILTVSQDLFTEPADLAVAHKLAGALRQAANRNPNWGLNDLSDELTTIARNERRFLGFSDDDGGFEPEKYRGRIVLTTLHKAKGLEWDRVFILSVNNYNFPSGEAHDTYHGEYWFIRDHLNLEAEALEQLRVALSRNEYDWYEEGAATQAARASTVRERLRLLYVGITRAKQSLTITYNTGIHGTQLPALPLMMLQDFFRQQG